MKKQTLCRLLSLVLCLIMCLSLLPASAFAEGEVAEGPTEALLEAVDPEAPAEEPEEPAEEPKEPAEDPEEPAEELEEPAEEPEEPAEEPEEPAEESEEPAEEPEEPAEEPEEPAEEPEEPAEDPEEPAEEPEDENIDNEQDSENVNDKSAEFWYDHADGTPQPVAGTLTVGKQVKATVTTDTQVFYYRFVPDHDGTYLFFSVGDENTYGYLYDANWHKIINNDDGGDNGNFMITRALKANTTYYYAFCYYNDHMTGTITVMLSELKQGWVKVGTTWYYYDNNGKTLKGWQTIGSARYCFDSYGAMYADGSYYIDDGFYFFTPSGALAGAGWQKRSETYVAFDGTEQKVVRWYYTNGDGSVLTSWQKISGKWYFFQDNGEMVADGGYATDTVGDEGALRIYYFQANGVWDNSAGWKTNTYGDRYCVGSNGQLLTGWQKISKKWYFFDPGNGRMLSGTVAYIEYTPYFFTDSGALAGEGWQKVNYIYHDPSGGEHTETYWYYTNADGTVVTGWKKISGSWYYFNPDWSGQMVYGGICSIKGKDYFFTASGALSKGGWEKQSFTVYDSGGNAHAITLWFYTNADGTVITGWKKISGSWYYFDPSNNGMMISGMISHVDEKDYFFTASGALSKGGWQELSYSYTDYDGSEKTASDWYYTNNDGTVATGWKKISGAWYYLDPAGEGVMVAGCIKEIDGERYFFGSGGALQTGWIKNLVTDDFYGTAYTYTDWYYANGKGELQTGWQEIGGKKYYFEPINCSMIYDYYHDVDGDVYFFTSSGALAGAGWQSRKYEYNGDTYTLWYYTNDDGTLVEGWKKIGSYWYYFDCEMLAGGLYWVEGKYEFFRSNGTWVATGANTSWRRMNDGKMRYVENGKYVKGWKQIDGTYFYFESNGDMLEHGWVDSYGKRYFCGPEMYNDAWYYIEGESYFFDASGAMKTGWIKDSYTLNGQRITRWYYAESDGHLVTGWKTLNGWKYYFDQYDYSMYADGSYYIDGYTYTFKANGICSGRVYMSS